MIRITLFILGLVLVGSAFYFDLLRFVTLENVIELKDRLGWWAPVVFALAFIVGELLQVPSVLWVFFAGVIWPVWLAIPISLVSALLAATVAFVVARYFLGNRFHEKLPERFQALNQKIESSPLKAVVLIRITTFLHPFVHWALAASPIKWFDFLLGTLIGILPATVAIVLLGQQFIDWWEQYSSLIIGFVVALIILSVLYNKAKAKKAKAKEAEAEAIESE